MFYAGNFVSKQLAKGISQVYMEDVVSSIITSSLPQTQTGQENDVNFSTVLISESTC